MLNKDTMVSITNRDNGTVGYSIQDLNIRRDFMPKETKEVTVEEIRKLSYQPGGRNLIKGYFIIDNKELIKEILGEVEPEYFYKEEDIKNLLEEGTLNQLKDCLDYAPIGVIELIKSIAVDIKLSDINKRKAIFDKTGFNITNAISFREEEEEKEEEVSDNKEEKNSKRRAPIPKRYKVVMEG